MLAFLLIAACWSCGTNADQKTTEEDVVEETENFVIHPGEGFADFTDEQSKEDLLNALGKSSVADQEFYLGEGEYAPGLALYPGTAEEVEVLLDEDGYPMVYRIEKEGSKWATAEGLKVGSSLAALEEANGKPFRFTGFDWDYGGTVTNWNEGKLADKDFMAVLGYDNENTQFAEEDMNKLLGDQEITSTLPALQRYSIKVVSIIQRY